MRARRKRPCARRSRHRLRQATLLKAVRTVVARLRKRGPPLSRERLLRRCAVASGPVVARRVRGVRRRRTSSRPASACCSALQTGYPTSKFARQAPAEISLLRAATPAAAPVLTPAPPPAAVAAPVQPTPRSRASVDATVPTTATPGPSAAAAIAAASGRCRRPRRRSPPSRTFAGRSCGDTVRIIIELDRKCRFMTSGSRIPRGSSSICPRRAPSTA